MQTKQPLLGKYTKRLLAAWVVVFSVLALGNVISSSADTVFAEEGDGISTAHCEATTSVDVTSGQSVEWDADVTTTGDSVTISWSGDDGLSGSAETIEHTYGSDGTMSGTITVDVSSENGEASCDVAGIQTTVIDDSVTPSVTLDVDPEEIEEGDSSELTWTSEDAVSCESEDFDTFDSVSGSVNVSPASTTEYTITCESDTGDTDSDSATVTVVEGEEGEGPTVDLKVNGSDGPLTVATSGTSTSIELSWETTGDPTMCVASDSWSGFKTTDGGTEDVTVETGSHEFTVECSNDEGSDIDTVEVTVEEEDEDELTVDLKANGSDGPITIDEGSTTTLSWDVDNADTCEAGGDWSGSKAASSDSEVLGALAVGDYSFDLTCENEHGTSSDSVEVTVEEEDSSDDDKEIDAGAIGDYDCNADEWHFVITQTDGDEAPESIHVEWENGAEGDVELGEVTGGVAHYSTSTNLSSPVVGATADIAGGWDGQFNLSHGPCFDDDDNGGGGDDDDDNDDEPKQCLLPQAGSSQDEVDLQDGADGEPLQDMLDDNGYSIDADDDQVNYADWKFEKATTTLEITYVDAIADDSNVFGYYTNGNLTNFTPIFQEGNHSDFGSTADATPGDTFTVEVPGSAGDTIGFAIATENGNKNVFATDNGENTNGVAHAVSFDLGNSYVIGFEDQFFDEDYQDMVVEVEVVGCEEEEEEEEEVLTIVASKIVCEDESDLPNWHGGADVDEDTAQTFVENNPQCELVPDWEFQWGYGENDEQSGVTDPGGDVIGEATSTGSEYDEWKTFGPTNASGTAMVEIDDIKNASRIWVREVLKDNFVLFSDAKNQSGNDSAEMWCHEDVLNYDNFDFVGNPELNETYHCVALNAPAAAGTSTPDVDLKANDSDGPVTVDEGSTTTLSWEVLDADSCEAGGDWSGSKAASSSSEDLGVLAVGDYSFDLTCENEHGTSSDSVDVTVEEDDGNGGGGDDTPDVDLKVNDSDGPITIDEGATTTLTWDVIDADTCEASGGFGWSGSRSATSGSEVLDTLPIGSHTFDLDCANEHGTSTDSVDVTVEEEDDDDDDDNNGGGGGRGGGGGISGGRYIPPSDDEDEPEGEVLGIQSCTYLEDFLHIDWQNDPVEVAKLQYFLREFEGYDIEMTTVYDQQTYNTVVAFQERYFDDVLAPWGHTAGTGFTYITTRKKVNEIICNREFPLSDAQLDEITAFRNYLASFGIGGQAAGAHTQAVGDDASDNDSNAVAQLDDAEEAATTSTGTNALAGLTTSGTDAIKSMAAAALTLPDDLGDLGAAAIMLLLILAIVFLLGTVIVNAQKDTQELPSKSVWARKILVFIIGIIVIGTVVFFAGFTVIAIPLLLVLILLAIALLWLINNESSTSSSTTTTSHSA